MRRPMATWLSILTLVSFFVGDVSTARAEKTVNPSGTWKWYRNLEGNEKEDQSVLKLKYSDGKLTGQYTRGIFKAKLKNGKLEGDQLSFEFGGEYGLLKVQAHFQGKVGENSIIGTVNLAVGDQAGELDWEAKRSLDHVDVHGKWKFQIETTEGRVIEPVLELTPHGKETLGLYTSPLFGQFAAQQFKIKGAEFSFYITGENDGQSFKVTYAGKPKGELVKGTLEIESGGESTTMKFTGKRMAEKKKKKGEPSPNS